MSMDLRTLGTNDSQQEQEQELTPRSLPVTVEYTDPEGSSHRAVCESRIMTGDERILCDRRASLLAQIPLSDLGDYARARCEALALVSTQLRDIPDWLNKWVQEDDRLLFALREELERHTLRFFWGDNGESEKTQRVAVSSSLSPTNSSESV